VFDAALGASSVSWSLVQAAVAAVTQACSYDRAGFGWSEGGPLPRTAGRIADELYVLLHRSGVAPPYLLVGHSFGGLVMRVFASRYRDETAGLVLLDPAHPEQWLEPDAIERLQIDRGVRLCRYGALAARFGLARVVAALVGIGALLPARAVVKVVSRGDLRREDEGILAPIWKLPPSARRPLRRFWTEEKFYRALGSQIATICDSAEEAAESARQGFGDLRLTVVSPANPDPVRLRRQNALAGLSSRGCHVIASRSGHWIPLDEPQLVIELVTQMVDAIRQPAAMHRGAAPR
jgi:pimeloyl-ACP methyl ester carboxylesterase